MKHREVNEKAVYTLCVLTPIVLVFISLFLGRYGLHFKDVVDILRGGYSSTTIDSTVVWDIRMPRALLAVVIGGALGVSGGALQGVFRNPLVDSGMLGVSSGAGFGACLAIILFDSTALTYISAFVFALTAVGLSYLAGTIYKNSSNISIVLGGVIISSIFSSLIAFTKYVADPYEELPAITFWLMGSLATGDYGDILFSAVPVFGGVAGIMMLRWRINVMSIGDREARSLGVNVKFCRNMIIICASLATAGAVCVSGTIGWIGLIIPHIARMIVGNDNRKIIPICFSIGGCFLIVVDNLARIVSGGEMPIGVLTSIIGGPFYIYLLKKTKGGSWN